MNHASEPATGRPALILVTGSPGSGKTTLATLLQHETGYPLLCRDTLKEVLLDAMPPRDRADSQRIGGVSWDLFHRLIGELAGRTPLIVEANFSRGRHEPALLPHLAGSASVAIHCRTDRATIEHRIAARADDATRHPGHFDVKAWPDLAGQLDAGTFSPLDLPCPTLIVDTTSGLDPALTAILAFARSPGRIASR